MKTNHNSDPLDQQIDALLASRPVKPNEDFTARVLAASETAKAEDSTRKAKRPLGTLIKLALPLAAAIAVTISISLWPVHTDSVATAASAESAALSTAEVQEIFLLEESLASLANIDASGFGSADLLSILDALYLEI
ncbi:MAG: hypothetical protein ISR41_05620 [Puniceicoccaceae bacterium]|nr:hypothetical protein [Puniceicoccaceae bacterium]